MISLDNQTLGLITLIALTFAGLLLTGLALLATGWVISGIIRVIAFFAADVYEKVEQWREAKS